MLCDVYHILKYINQIAHYELRLQSFTWMFDILLVNLFYKNKLVIHIKINNYYFFFDKVS